MSDYSADAFGRLVGKTFSLIGADFEFTLESVDPGDIPNSFILIFKGLPHPVLIEGLHAFDVEGSEYTFHVMPILTHARDRQDYQAVFN